FFTGFGREVVTFLQRFEGKARSAGGLRLNWGGKLVQASRLEFWPWGRGDRGGQGLVPHENVCACVSRAELRLLPLGRSFVRLDRPHHSDDQPGDGAVGHRGRRQSARRSGNGTFVLPNGAGRAA